MIILQTLVDDFGFKLLTPDVALEALVTSVNSCDLLSWVMAHGKENEAWITVQTHTNILAVTSLLDMACVIVPEGISVDVETIEKAIEKEIPLFSTPLSVFEIFTKFYEKGMR